MIFFSFPVTVNHTWKSSLSVSCQWVGFPEMFWLWTWGSTVSTRPTPSCWDQSPVGATSSGTECLVRVAVVLYTFFFLDTCQTWEQSENILEQTQTQEHFNHPPCWDQTPPRRSSSEVLFSHENKVSLSHLCNFNPKLDSSLRRTLYFWLQKMQKNNKPNVTLMCSGNDECAQH